MEVVRIPLLLIERLKPFGGRYIKVSKPQIGDPKTGKSAIEAEWQNHPYDANDPELLKHLEQGGNYGVMAGWGVFQIDVDKSKLLELLKQLPETFVVRSGSGKGFHYYFRGNITENAVILDKLDENGKRENLGNLQARNKYLVGPGCRHYSGGTYDIIKDLPLAWVDKELLDTILGELIIWNSKQKESDLEHAKEEAEKLGFDIPITDLVDMSKLRRIGADEWQGPHPVHGSTTGVNFCVNPEKNCWHCFRCGSGGGPLSWLAVREGLIQCNEAHKGVLRGELFKRTVEIARRLGYKIPIDDGTGELGELAKYFRGKPPAFVPSRLGEELIERHKLVTRPDDGTIFLYHPDRGIYLPDGEVQMRKSAQEILKEESNIRRIAEVISFIKNATLSKKEFEDPDPYLLILQNGVLDLNTFELKSWSEDIFATNSLPVKYDPDTDCPKIKKFIDEIVTESDAQILQELVGYCLVRHYRYHKAFMLVGSGANGKSTFLELLAGLLGEDNVSSVPLQSFETNQFIAADLYSKLANIYADLSDKALSQTGVFKMLTGEDLIRGEHKYQNAFYFRNYAKLVYSTNNMPEARDDTEAFFRRWIIINFPNTFRAGDPKTDPYILQKLATEDELSGFLNWALEGLRRLEGEKAFSSSKTVDEVQEQWTRMSSPIRAFVMDCIQKEAGSDVSKNEVYAAYILYCQKYNLPTETKYAFNLKLQQYVPGLSDARIQKEGKREPYWRDIKLSPVSSLGSTLIPTGESNTILDEDENRVTQEKITSDTIKPSSDVESENFYRVSKREEKEPDEP